MAGHRDHPTATVGTGETPAERTEQAWIDDHALSFDAAGCDVTTNASDGILRWRPRRRKRRANFDLDLVRAAVYDVW
jgi:hypothetical protein